MKRAVWILLILMLAPACNARGLANVPENTMQIAREAEIRAAFEQPKSEIVRVGIGNNSFSSYDYSETNIFGTAEVAVFDNDTEITTIPADKVINVRFSSDMFVIS